MKNSHGLEAKHERNLEQRRAFVREWAEFVRTNPDDVWGEQVKTLIDSQIETSQALDDSRVDRECVQNSPLLSDDG